MFFFDCLGNNATSKGHFGGAMESKTKITNIFRSTYLQTIVFVMFMMLACQAQALTENYVPHAWDYVFYTFAFSGVVFSAAIISAYREYRWLWYVGFSVLLLVSSASFDGALAYFIGQRDFVIWVLPYLLTSTTTAYGFFVVALNLELPHSVARLKLLFIVLAVISALFALTSVIWLGKVSLTIMWLPVNILFFTMILTQILPPLTWQGYDRRLNQLMQVFPVLVGLCAVIIHMIHFSSSGFSRTELNEINRLLLLAVAFFFVTIVIWQAFVSHRAKEFAQREVLTAARQAAEMQLTLMQAEKDYEEAKAIASRHQSQLAFVSHDLKQPITALRVAIQDLERMGKQQGTERLAEAVDYIDSLSRSYIAEIQSSDGVKNNSSDREIISTKMLAQAVQQMFAKEAERRGIQLTVRGADHSIIVEPLSAMRLITNLVENALAHANARRLLVGFRRKGNKMVFQLHDDGCGMEEKELENALMPGVKGLDSEGQGLGLKIVQDLSREQGVGFRICSSQGKGTSVYLEFELEQGQISNE